MHVTNYWLMSLLSQFSKILEKLMYNRLYSYLKIFIFYQNTYIVLDKIYKQFIINETFRIN